MIPASVRPFIDWDTLVDNSNQLARFDILPTNEGYVFCEFNFGSPIGGSEEFDCFVEFAQALNLQLTQGQAGPRREMATMIKQIVIEKQLERVVIFVLSKHRYLGYFSLEMFRQHLQEELGISVCIVDETDYPATMLDDQSSAKTLVYRMFVADDIEEHGELFERLWSSNATIVNGFEAEIRMSKCWFSLFHEVQYQSLLTTAQKAAVNQYIPYTFQLDPEDLVDTLANKSEYIFKINNGYSGKGILIGADTSANDISETLKQHPKNCWSAQRLIEFDGLNLPHKLTAKPQLNHVVLGLFLIKDKTVGMNVRASSQSKVVNVSSGQASSGWAFVLSSDELGSVRDQLENRVSDTV
jgi:hypothetical protein